MRTPIRVLIVEDEPLIACLYEDYFTGTEFKVIADFDCGSHANEYIRANDFDLAIVDFKLRDGPCHSTVEALRRHKKPFLIVSGYDEADQDFAGLPWLAKPFRQSTLMIHLRALIDQHATKA